MADHFSATYTFTNDTAVSLATMYAADATAAALPGQMRVRFVILQAETNGIRLGFKQTPVAGSVGAVTEAGESAKFEGEGAYHDLKVCNAVAGQNARVHIILVFGFA